MHELVRVAVRGQTPKETILQTSRRNLLRGAAVLAGTGVLVQVGGKPRGVAAATLSQQPERIYEAANFEGWEVLLGDGVSGSVGMADIETLHAGDHSELRANVRRRPIAAHNITLTRINDPSALEFVQRAQYEFRLPFVPRQDLGARENAQTIEGMLVTWDGSGERRDLGVGFQWYLNPWDDGKFGEIRSWTTADDVRGKWERVGHLPVDTNWHSVRMEVDYPRRTASLWIDGRPVTTSFTATSKPASWGRETAARLTAEIISCDPGDRGYSALHRAEFRNWSWQWQRR